MGITASKATQAYGQGAWAISPSWAGLCIEYGATPMLEKAYLSIFLAHMQQEILKLSAQVKS